MVSNDYECSDDELQNMGVLFTLVKYFQKLSIKTSKKRSYIVKAIVHPL